MKLDTYLINNSHDSTRLYCCEEADLTLTVVCRSDTDYIKDCKHLLCDAFYVLIWPWARPSDDSRHYYIGQTADARKRMLQHLKKKPPFTDACVFTRLSRPFTKT